ncbi:MAG: hypothetical protein ABI597_10260 [Gammaproteobacteria bacterium]
MQFGRYTLVFLISLTLLACASPHMSQELEGGKVSFQAGYYKEAFHKLLPIAVQGRPEAQYAVGYMYYYGYGVPEDTESGIFWMHKAAEQNYVPAIQALEVIHQSNPPFSQPNTTVGYTESRVTYQKDKVIMKEEVIQPTQEEDSRKRFEPIHSSQKTKPGFLSENDKPLLPAKKISEQQEPETITAAPRKYTLQLFGSYHIDSVKELQAGLKLRNTGHIYLTSHNGKDWYILTFGRFVTALEATATKPNLPAELKDLKPWVRSVDEMKLA